MSWRGPSSVVLVVFHLRRPCHFPLKFLRNRLPTETKDKQVTINDFLYSHSKPFCLPLKKITMYLISARFMICESIKILHSSILNAVCKHTIISPSSAREKYEISGLSTSVVHRRRTRIKFPLSKTIDNHKPFTLRPLSLLVISYIIQGLIDDTWNVFVFTF